MMGRGFGKVFLALNRNKNEKVAIKSIDLEKMKDNQIKKEVSSMQQCRSPFTVHYYDSFTRGKHYYVPHSSSGYFTRLLWNIARWVRLIEN